MAEEDNEVISLEGLDRVLEEEVKNVERPGAPTEKSSPTPASSAFDHYKTTTNVVDQILNLEDEKFSQSLKELEGLEASDDVDAELVDIPLAQFTEKKKVSRIGHFFFKARVLFIPFFWVWETFNRVFGGILKICSAFIRGFVYAFGEGRKQVLTRLLIQLKALKDRIQSFVKFFRRLSWGGRFSLLGFIIVLVFTFRYFFFIVQAQFLPQFNDTEVVAIDQFATEAYEYDKQNGYESFDSPLRNPEYVVQLKQVTVNLKDTQWRRGSLAIMQFYLQASNQETAVEIKDREAQILDIVQREIESMSYEELNQSEGTLYIKAAVRQSVNKILSKGRVNKVFIHRSTLKP